MTASLIVLVNSTVVQVSPPATALDAVRAWNADAAREVEQQITLITDSRGLPIPADTPMSAGSILRLIPVREHAARGESDVAPPNDLDS